MAYKITDEFRRPAPLALAAFAIVGWVLVAYFSSRVSTIQSKMSDAINRAEHAREGMAADLQDLQKALGSLTDVQKQAEEAKIALSKATAARAASQNELTDLNKQISDARLAVSGAQEQARARARDFQAIDTKAKVAADQLADLQGKIQTAQNQWEAATSERDKTLAAVANAKDRLSDLEQQTDAAAKSLAGLQEQSGATAKNLAALQQQDTEASATLADLQAKIQTAQNQWEAATSERDKTLAAVANAKDRLSDLEQQTTAAAKSLAGLQEQSGATAKNLAALQQQDTEASATLADLQAKIQTAQNQWEAATSERDKTLAAVANAKDRLSDLEQQTDAAAKSLAGLQEQSGATAKNLAALQQQDTEASATLADLQAKIQTAQNQWEAATSERDKTLAAVANAKDRLSDLEQQTDAAAKSLAGLQEQSGATAKNLAALQQQDTEASATLADLQAKIQTAQNQWEAATSERDKTLAAVANAKDRLSDLEQQTDAGAKSVGSLPKQSGVATKNLAALHQTTYQGFRNARRPASQVVKGCTNAPRRR